MGCATAKSGLGAGLGAIAAAKLGVCVVAGAGAGPTALPNTSKAPAPAAASMPPVTAAVTSVFLPGPERLVLLLCLAVIDAIPSPASEPVRFIHG